jgi:MoCo/4Fe-4S cofactor protein with predicted Tat translocation signal
VDETSSTSSQRSRRYWKSLEQWENTPEFRRLVHDEFAPGVLEGDAGPSRRTFLKALAASMAMAGLAGCKQKITEQIVPYVRQPAEITPGRPLYFATSMTLGGYAQGVLATSREGRPVKLDGNPDHPANLGSSDVFLQAELLNMYDPDRSQSVMRDGVITDWDTFVGVIRPRLAQNANGNARLAILTERISSPTLLKQIGELKKKFPGAQWFVQDPLAPSDGMVTRPRFDFSKANVIVSIDSDFLFDEPGHSRYAREFLDGRRIRAGTTRMNRLYVIESTATITGTMADHRWAMSPSRIASAANEIAAAISEPGSAQGWAKAIADDLLANKGKSLVIAGVSHPADVQAIVRNINTALGNVDRTVHYVASITGTPDGSLADLIQQMDRGAVDTLFILGGNPCYTAPADLPFDSALETFSKQTDRNLTVRLGLYDDETSFKCQWHLPQTHFLEEWGDGRAYDGTVSMVQPLIAPLYEGKSAIQVLDLLLTGYPRGGYEIAREFWFAQHSEPDFESVWRRSIEKGIWLGNFKPAPANSTSTAVAGQAATQSTGGFELVFRPDPCIWDGTYTNNAFLQELPKPLTKLTWDNAALISVNSAAKLSVTNGDMLRITSQARSLDIPAWIVPGVPDGTVTLHLGYGRWRAGSVGTGPGFNAYRLRTSDRPWFVAGAEVAKIEGSYQLVATHAHQTIASRKVGDLEAHVVQHPGSDELDNRKLIRAGTLGQFIDDPNFVKKLDAEDKRHLTLYPGFDNIYKNNLAWGMSIDLQSCIGCNACVLACQTENNIPVVGKDQVSRGREMHWIRIDTYYEGDPESPSAAYHQPVPCQQCENAPCELVCPVGATVHDNEGLNEMVYNRCVGTRYCSNNCPYKVRRFNFYQFVDETTESLKLMRNPEVTVRSRGVMEKCTYCIQRIVAAREDMELLQVQMDEQARNATSPDEAADIQKRSAELRQRKLDGLQTACQQACPTQAIVFGNINPVVDPIHGISPDYLSTVAQLKKEPLNYSLLAELITQPRTTYLGRIFNPNPALAEEGQTS